LRVMLDMLDESPGIRNIGIDEIIIEVFVRHEEKGFIYVIDVICSAVPF
jgi:hypothetical protein